MPKSATFTVYDSSSLETKKQLGEHKAVMQYSQLNLYHETSPHTNSKRNQEINLLPIGIADLSALL